jgi:phosphatidylglycerophosphate synthase
MAEAARRSSYREVREAAIPLSNWSKFFVQPLSCGVLWLLVNYLPIHPTTLTAIGGVLGIAAAPLYWRGDGLGLIVGGALYYLSFAIDTIDGALARLTKRTSTAGEYLDVIFDFLRTGGLAAAFAIGTYRATGDLLAIYCGFGLALVGVFHYLMAELTIRMTGHRPGHHLAESDNALARLLRRIGLYHSPFALHDIEALYLVFFPLFGQRLLGLMIALGLAVVGRTLAVLFILRRLWVDDKGPR